MLPPPTSRLWLLLEAADAPCANAPDHHPITSSNKAHHFPKKPATRLRRAAVAVAAKSRDAKATKENVAVLAPKKTETTTTTTTTVKIRKTRTVVAGANDLRGLVRAYYLCRCTFVCLLKGSPVALILCSFPHFPHLSEELHRDFVSAIFDVGLKHSSPSAVLEHMPEHEHITTERIKSHLQKYRVHRQKSKQEFLTSYAATVQKLQQEGLSTVGTSLAGGEVAGHLTYATLTQPDPPPPVVAVDEASVAKTHVSQGSRDTSPGQPPPQDTIVLPRLTEVEKQSPIGHSLGYLIGLFFSLKEQLDRQRRQKELAAAEAEKKFLEQQSLQHAAVFDAFANDQHPPQQQQTPGGLPSALQQPPSVAMAPPPPCSNSNNNTGSLNPPTIQQSTTRSNLEQSSMMKREMQSQMTFQNKLRALKQQELNKYNKLAHDMAQQQQQQVHMQQQQQQLHDSKPAAVSDMASMHAAELPPQQQQQQQEEYQQGTGDAGTDRGASARTLSMADEDDFWNTAVVDDELFDFLMSD